MTILGSMRIASRVGITAMRANPVRAFLAMLGVVIGSGALVSILSVTDGVEKYARIRVSRQGFNRLNVRPISQDTVDGQWVARQKISMISVADLGSLGSTLVDGEHVMLSREGIMLTELHEAGRPRALLLRGVALTAPDTLGESLLAGRYLTPEETRSPTPLAIVNRPLARALTGDSANAAQRALGDSIQIGQQWFRIIGVITADDAAGQIRPPLTLTVPFDVAARALASAPRPPQPEMMVVLTSRAEGLRDMRGRVEGWLEARDADWSKNYRIEARSESQLLDVQRGLLIFRILMGSITGITLLVGGIGIMNVLLASVAERTREIGIRKSVGARRRDILLQFLAESVTITGLGSAIGTALGLGVAYAVTALMRQQTQAIIYAATTPKTIMISAGLAVLVGLAFGCYPAARAAKLAPIDVIHTE